MFKFPVTVGAKSSPRLGARMALGKAARTETVDTGFQFRSASRY